MTDAAYYFFTGVLIVAGLLEIWRRNWRRRAERGLSVEIGKWEGFADYELAELGAALTLKIRQRPPAFYEDAQIDRCLYEEIQREVAFRHALVQKDLVSAR